MTKNEMARVIVQALLGMKTLPKKDSPKVKEVERRNKSLLIGPYTKALELINK